MIHKIILFCCGWLLSINLLMGQEVTLQQCHQLAKANYPAIKKLDLIAKTSEYDLQNVQKSFLPQLNFSGQATYQSQTVSFSDALAGLPSGISLPSISKDQYKIQGEISQLLYDGGSTGHQKALINANKTLQESNLQVSLYAIDARINTIYFSILLMDAQLKQNEINKANLQTQLQKIQAALENGVAFRSNVDELKAEVLSIQMQETEYKSNRTAFLKMLSLFIGKELTSSTQLVIPQSPSIETTINRPELKYYENQRSLYDIQRQGLKSDYLPKVSAFFQGAYGRPTLNIIENKFGPWYITGIKLNWSLGSLYTLSNKKSTLLLNQQSVEAQKETFLRNTQLELIQQNEEVKKYKELMVQDDEAIALRASVLKSAEAQLANGVITTHEYIQKANAENLARQTQILHHIQLLRATYDLEFITGN